MCNAHIENHHNDCISWLLPEDAPSWSQEMSPSRLQTPSCLMENSIRYRILHRASADPYKLLKIPPRDSGPATLTTAGSSFPPVPRSMRCTEAGVRKAEPGISHSNRLADPIHRRQVNPRVFKPPHWDVPSIWWVRDPSSPSHLLNVPWSCQAEQRWPPLCPALRFYGAYRPSLHAHWAEGSNEH